MKPVALVFLTGWVAFTAWSAATGQPPQKPVRVVAHDHPPEHSEDTELRPLFLGSELVVVGTVVAERPVDRTFDFGGTLVETAYDVDIAEVFRFAGSPDDQPQSAAVIVYHVGDRDRGEYIERYVNASVNPLRVGQRYLLFLRHRFGDANWTLVGESGRAVVHIRGSVVAPQASSPLAMRLAKQRWPDLRAELLRLAKER